jgi:hydroxymethylpyrimidine kinase/phosphomethylpyrimidine kinase
MKYLCIIGGFDPTGHAGVLRDAQVVQRCGIAAQTLVTALTIQNDRKYFGHHILPTNVFLRSWEALPLKELTAVKIGMLGSLSIVKNLVTQLERLKRVNKRVKVVWDPVFSSSSGGELLPLSAVRWAVKNLTPHCDLVTPNTNEVLQFVKPRSSQPETWCAAFWQKYHVPVYLKGGHLPTRARDWLHDGRKLVILDGQKSGKKIRGTGCYFATAVACGWVQGKSLLVTCQLAKEMMQREFC